MIELLHIHALVRAAGTGVTVIDQKKPLIRCPVRSGAGVHSLGRKPSLDK
jgi:hypothetical protein